MIKWLKPTWMVKSIYSITPAQLEKNNIKAVLTDLDNTLIAWNDPEATEESILWIENMKKNGIPVIILSNNSDKRVKVVAEHLGLDYIPRSLKPSRRGLRLAQEKLGLPKEQILMVGDQVMTDVLASNRFGVRNVLVKPILASDAWNTKLNRFIELNVMKALIQSNPNIKWGDSLEEPIR